LGNQEPRSFLQLFAFFFAACTKRETVTASNIYYTSEARI
jgi:hypothetical protein